MGNILPHEINEVQALLLKMIPSSTLTKHGLPVLARGESCGGMPPVLENSDALHRAAKEYILLVSEGDDDFGDANSNIVWKAKRHRRMRSKGDDNDERETNFDAEDFPVTIERKRRVENGVRLPQTRTLASSVQAREPSPTWGQAPTTYHRH